MSNAKLPGSEDLWLELSSLTSEELTVLASELHGWGIEPEPMTPLEEHLWAVRTTKREKAS